MINLSGKSITSNKNIHTGGQSQYLSKNKNIDQTQKIIYAWNSNLILVDCLKRSNYIDKEDKIEVKFTSIFKRN